ncbi:MAG TPA: hypothetical protein DCE78_09925 [Bacteroidetes bacterium]|nr:hypothetical protein [Bacteroidota bacterium]
MTCNVYSINSKTAEEFPYLIELQHAHMSILPTVLVAPISTVRSDAPPAIPKLCPSLYIDGIPHCVHIPMMATIRRSLLGAPLNPDKIELNRFEIQASVDLLISGF